MSKTYRVKLKESNKIKPLVENEMSISKKEMRQMRKQISSLGFSSYKEFLNSSIWKAFKEHIKTKMWTDLCWACGCDLSNTRWVFHHTSYKDMLSYSNVKTVCKDCHQAIHYNHEGSVQQKTDSRRKAMNYKRPYKEFYKER